MSKSTISTFQLFEMFPTAESARLYLESRLWPDGAFCPECKSRERIGKQPKVGFYRCNACSLDFTIRTGTIFERSHIPLHKWLYAHHAAGMRPQAALGKLADGLLQLDDGTVRQAEAHASGVPWR
jgi:hypothetical protein